jgi:hypothetical protein
MFWIICHVVLEYVTNLEHGQSNRNYSAILATLQIISYALGV